VNITNSGSEILKIDKLQMGFNIKELEKASKGPNLTQKRRVRVLNHILVSKVWDEEKEDYVKVDYITQKEIERFLNEDFDPMDPLFGGILPPRENEIGQIEEITPQVVSNLLTDLEEEGLIHREPKKIPGVRGPAQNVITIPKNYETFFKILGLCYDPAWSPIYPVYLGLNLINSDIGKALVNEDLVNKRIDETGFNFTIEEKETILSLFKISPAVIYRALQNSKIIGGYVKAAPFDFIVTQMEAPYKNRFFYALLDALGKDLLNHGFSSKIPVKYQIQIELGGEQSLNEIGNYGDYKIKENIISSSLNSRPYVEQEAGFDLMAMANNFIEVTNLILEDEETLEEVINKIKAENQNVDK